MELYRVTLSSGERITVSSYPTIKKINGCYIVSVKKMVGVTQRALKHANGATYDNCHI